MSNYKLILMVVQLFTATILIASGSGSNHLVCVDIHDAQVEGEESDDFPDLINFAFNLVNNR